MKQIRKRLTYANVMSSIAVFLVLGGATALAAGLAKNSVGTKQLKKNAVVSSKVKNGSLTGADMNVSTLGTVPSATSASHANSADNASHANSADSASHANSADSASHANSADNASHASSADNASNANALGGIETSHYVTSQSKLPSGDIESGVFGVAAPSGNWGVAPINFIPKLSAVPAHVEDAEGSVTANCPGAKQAAPDYLCIYEDWNYHMAFNGTRDLTTEGTTLYYMSDLAEGNVRGKWAYRAP
jgi:hypothetical protein